VTPQAGGTGQTIEVSIETLGYDPTSAAVDKNRLGAFLRRSDWVSRAAIVWLLILVFFGFVGPYLPIGSPDAIGSVQFAPAFSHWIFGTDYLGRAQLPRVIEGIRTTLEVAAVSVFVTTVLGAGLGMLAGTVGGAVDFVVSRITDTFFVFPALLLALLITAVIGPGPTAIVTGIVLISFPLMARVVRSATLSLRERDFVVTARVSGASLPRILLKHIAPNITGVVITQVAYAASVSILIESSLSFLGVGIQPPQASLGSLVHDGTAYLTVAPGLVFIPGAVLASLILAINLIGDGLIELFDHRPESLLG
jgi:peptide/nickel transport system permease protein